ncbi:hypothetical protein [Streptomyces sp. DH37]|uniref:hypothetical protein n=1 Tax=Streptomyces sp. DH37 TaxID=3040122 RepID=UPI0024422CFB|nr:hypothetical protein [Streptomyces sp. DH37]MDG9703839.1 hypothetical protein [Streptomyces sp. DH37]
MTRDEARHVEQLLTLCAQPGVAAPVDPDDEAGQWQIYDRGGPGRRDITAAALRAIRPKPGSHAVRSAGRGFIVPQAG